MVTKFEELVHGMVNIGFGAAALTAEKWAKRCSTR